jgi:hypothetical protein
MAADGWPDDVFALSEEDEAELGIPGFASTGNDDSTSHAFDTWLNNDTDHALDKIMDDQGAAVEKTLLNDSLIGETIIDGYRLLCSGALSALCNVRKRSPATSQRRLRSGPLHRLPHQLSAVQNAQTVKTCFVTIAYRVVFGISMQPLSPDMSAAAVRVLVLTITSLVLMALIPLLGAMKASEATVDTRSMASTTLCLRLWKHTRRESIFPKEFYY